MPGFVIHEHGPHVRHAQMVKLAIPLQGIRVVGPPVFEGKSLRRHRDLLCTPLILDMWLRAGKWKTSGRGDVSGDCLGQARAGGAEHIFKRPPQRDIDVFHRHEQAEIHQRGDAVTRVDDAAGHDR